MGWFNKIFGKAVTEPEDHALVITLDGTSLPVEVYEQCDTSTLEDKLQEALGDLGECDGTEHGERDSRIFLYGSDAEAMFRAIEPTLLTYPLAASARVLLRSGPPGAPEREVRLP
ncbi:MAG TPA: hypothetical protein VH331_01135 [Allosphingosinicella sp.]|jgi:hypothetical protein|nr:hypothetical protein [Allosphingosinicella sp.]